MSQSPSPLLGYATGRVQPQDPVPKCVRVISIMAIALGGFAAMGGLAAIAQYTGMSAQANAAIDAARADSVVRNGTIAISALGVIVALSMVAGGIGALRLRPWARRTLTWYAIADISTTMVVLPLKVILINPRMLAVIQTANQKTPSPNPAVQPQAMRIVQYFGVTAAALFLIFPVVVLWYMNRPDVIHAFEAAAPNQNKLNIK